MAKWLWFQVPLFYWARLAIADNDFTYTGTPVAGQPFTITWTPGTYTTVDILLNHLTGYPYYVPTTSVPIVGKWRLHFLEHIAVVDRKLTASRGDSQ
jgi:hypothetical protein